jgi:tetratricopeptide (TPR) repeat protein
VAAVGVALALAVSGCGSSSKKAATGTTTTTLSATDKLLQDGLAAQGAGKLDDARALYLKVIAADPANKIAFYDLGVIYQQLNSTAEARDAYGKALAIDAKYQPALFNLAVLETPGDKAKAAALYQQILDINPNDANVHLNLGLLLRDMGRQADSDTHLKRAVELDPTLASRAQPATTTTTTVATTTTVRR